MKSLIVIGASTGGMQALCTIFSALPADFPAAVLVVTHIGARVSVLPDILAQTSALPVRYAQHDEPVRPGRILMAPPDRHMLVAMQGGQCLIELTRGPKENHTRPSIDPLFRSAAAVCGPAVIGVILTGYLDDGTAGAQAIHACGGRLVVQQPSDAIAPFMPQSVIDHVQADQCLPVAQIAAALLALVDAAQPTTLANTSAPAVTVVENRFARGAGNMEELQKIATPSTFTCPECHGALWELHKQKPRRFRCHTGHSFTAAILAELQHEKAEDAIWAAVRALQEKERLYDSLAVKATAWQHAGTAIDYAAKAQQAREQAELLRAVLLRDAA